MGLLLVDIEHATRFGMGLPRKIEHLLVIMCFLLFQLMLHKKPLIDFEVGR